MKVGFTPDEVQAMYVPARAEVAVVFNKPQLLDLPLVIEDLGPFNEAIAGTSFPPRGRQARTPDLILFNERFLPHMYEDEVRYGLLHELTHAALPYSAAHGPRFQDAVGYLTGFKDTVLSPRLIGEVPIASNIIARLSGDSLRVDPNTTLGPVFE